MLIFDIDQTISPAEPRGFAKTWAEPHEVREAWGFEVAIPNYVLEVLRSRDDIALLSTWCENAADVAEAFEFNAQILIPAGDWLMQKGISSKFETVLGTDNVRGWADDHMTSKMQRTCAERGIVAVKPRGGVISRKQLIRFTAA